MIKKAVIDRFEGDLAVLIMKEREEQLVLPRKIMPEGVAEGTWLKVSVEDERVMSIEIDEKETGETKRRIAEKLARLKGKNQ